MEDMYTNKSNNCGETFASPFLERRPLMERITKQMILNGLQKGVIRLGNCEQSSNIVAYIGEYWFYFLSLDIQTEKELRKTFSEEEIVNMIWFAINNEPINDEDEELATECLYYKSILEEAGC